MLNETKYSNPPPIPPNIQSNFKSLLHLKYQQKYSKEKGLTILASN